MPPFLNRRMVAAEQDFGDLPAFVFGGAGVVRMVEDPGGKRILLGRLLVAKDAGDEPHDGIRNDQCGQHPAGENIVADGNFVIDEVIRHALVDAFIVAAEKNEVGFLGEFAGDGVGKFAPLRCEEDHFGCGGPDFSKREVDGLDLHDHSWSAAVGCVIHRAVAVFGPFAEVHRFERGEVFFLCPLENALRKNASADIGEDGEDLNFHRWSGRLRVGFPSKML